MTIIHVFLLKFWRYKNINPIWRIFSARKLFAMCSMQYFDTVLRIQYKPIYFISFLCLEPLPSQSRSRGLLKSMGTNWHTNFHLLDYRRQRCRRRYRRRYRHRCRLRHFMSSTDAAVERGCPVSGPLTWILCSNQDLLLKYGTARERRKEQQEQANGESDRTTRRGTETSR